MLMDHKRHIHFMLTTKMDKETPTIECIIPVCTCGNELSTLFYFLAANVSFMEFANEIKLSKADIDNMNFIDLSMFNQVCTDRGLIMCCIKNLRYGNTSSISIIKSTDQIQSGRKFPEALPGPSSDRETLSWL